MLLPRALTALLGIPLLLGLIHLGSIPFTAFVVAAALLALYEYALLLRLSGRGVQPYITVLGGGLLALATALGEPGGCATRSALPELALSGLVIGVMLREMFRGQRSLERAALSLFGALFVGWTLAHLALLRDLRPDGERWTYLLFLLIWITDTAAYAAGTALGSRRLAPAISPGKTWEGAAAGLAAALAAAPLLGKALLPSPLAWNVALALGLLIGVMGQLSDLAESVIKRAAGVKDSSALLPGHGGVLDRFDSFLLTTPVLYYALTLR